MRTFSAGVRLAFAILAFVALACGIPRDMEGTTERVRGGELRAGAIANPPWVIVEGGGVSGVEVELVEAFAAALGARVRWSVAPEAELVERLEAFRVDLVAGGLRAGDERLAKLGRSRPFRVDGEEHVLVVAPGENRFLVTLDRHLHAERERIAALAAGAAR
jgi:ABC-type amino acid transport substrate-binding protein